MSIIRAPRLQANFTILGNEVIQDSRLSYRASGVLHDILSRPDNWQTNAESLARARKQEGRQAIRTALKELQAAGYLVHTRVRDPETGQIRTISYIYDRPQATVDEDFLKRRQTRRKPPAPKKPTSGNPTSGEPDSGFLGPLTSTDSKDCQQELINKNSSCASSSSSPDAVQPAAREEDDAQIEKIAKANPSKRQQRAATQKRRKVEASNTMLTETHAEDDLDVKALAAFYEQDERYLADDGMLYLAGVIERDGSDKAAEHLDEARDIFGEWIDLERGYRTRRKQVADWLEQLHPRMAGRDKIADAFIEARRAGVEDARIAAAVEAIPLRGGIGLAKSYLSAIAALAVQVGAAA